MMRAASPVSIFTSACLVLFLAPTLCASARGRDVEEVIAKVEAASQPTAVVSETLELLKWAGTTAEEREECASLHSCYCIKNTRCGWCDTFKKSLPLSMVGVAGGVVCPNFVTAAASCPTLACASDDSVERAWWLQCAMMPGLCWVLWLVTYSWRDILHRYELARAADMSAARGPAVMTRLHADAVTADFFVPKRTLEIFKKGMHCPLEERLPLTTSRPYELNLSDLSCGPGENYEMSRVGPHRLSVTLRIALHWRTALGANIVNSSGCMLLSAVFILCLRIAARNMDQENYAWLTMATKEISAVVAPLQTAVGLLISFYALNRINWYWNVLMEGHLLQGRLHDLAMIGGAVKKDTEEDWFARYTLYRHSVLTLFFTYKPFTPSLRFLTFEPLMACGLLEHEEAQILQGAHRGPGTVLESWLTTWIAANLKAEARQQALNAMRELRRSIGVINALLDQRAPVSFESLLYVAVYALVAILPFSPSNIDYNNRQAVMENHHVATTLGVGILCSFYLALLHMLRHIQAPFDDIGAPNDALNCIALMNTTERKLRDYLTMPVSKGCTGEHEVVELHTRYF